MRLENPEAGSGNIIKFIYYFQFFTSPCFLFFNRKIR